MTKISLRSIPGLRLIGDNPDLWAVALLAVLLAGVQAPEMVRLRAVTERHVQSLSGEAAPWTPRGLGMNSAGAPGFRLSQIANRYEADDANDLEITLDEWASRLEQKRERLWQRLEAKMRKLEQRIEKQQMRIKYRSVAVRSE